MDKRLERIEAALLHLAAEIDSLHSEMEEEGWTWTKTQREVSEILKETA